LSPSSNIKESIKYIISDNNNRNRVSRHRIHQIHSIQYLGDHKNTAMSRFFHPPVDEQQIFNPQWSTYSFGTCSSISSSDHWQLSQRSLSHQNSQSCSSSMHIISEFIILPQKLNFHPNLLSGTHYNYSTSQHILMPLGQQQKTSYR